MTEHEALLACYRSGQMTERQWQDQLRTDPDLAVYANHFARLNLTHPASTASPPA